VVRGMVSNADDPPGGGRADLTEDRAHLSRPAIVHHPAGMAVAAASRAAVVS
jgi:hypothetical protein